MTSQVPGSRRYQMVARAESAVATGERILLAARALFGELSYDQVSLADVATRAQVTVRTVVRRVGSKESLFAAVASERARSIRELRDQARSGDPSSGIETLLESYEKWGDEVLHLLSQERRSETIAASVERGRAYHQDWVKRVFGPCLPNLSPANRRRRIAQLTAVTDVYTWKILRRDLGLDREEVAATLRDMIVRITG